MEVEGEDGLLYWSHRRSRVECGDVQLKELLRRKVGGNEV
jgi:hypothetical protein